MRTLHTLLLPDGFGGADWGMGGGLSVARAGVAELAGSIVRTGDRHPRPRLPSLAPGVVSAPEPAFDRLAQPGSRLGMVEPAVSRLSRVADLLHPAACRKSTNGDRHSPRHHHAGGVHSTSLASLARHLQFL